MLLMRHRGTALTYRQKFSGKKRLSLSLAEFSPSLSSFLALMAMAWLPLWLTVALLISPARSLTCKSQSFANNRLYSNCLDLPTLSSYLHWTYDSSNSSLTLAFVAPPAKSNGWIAWGLNPTGTGMAGAQSLLAMRRSDGAVVVKTYNISSYSEVVETPKLSLEVWDQSAEYSGGDLRIFAKMKVPKKASSVNYIWQVGSSVTDGRPDKHEFQPPNLNSKGTLSLTGSQTGTTTTAGSGVDSRTKRKNVRIISSFFIPWFLDSLSLISFVFYFLLFYFLKFMIGKFFSQPNFLVFEPKLFLKAFSMFNFQHNLRVWKLQFSLLSINWFTLSTF